jgi:hypothetical protein
VKSGLNVAGAAGGVELEKLRFSLPLPVTSIEPWRAFSQQSARDPFRPIPMVLVQLTGRYVFNSQSARTLPVEILDLAFEPSRGNAQSRATRDLAGDVVMGYHMPRTVQLTVIQP